MKLSTLIRKLESIHSAHGEMQVTICGEYSGITGDIKIVLDSDPDGMQLFLDEDIGDEKENII